MWLSVVLASSGQAGDSEHGHCFTCERTSQTSRFRHATTHTMRTFLALAGLLAYLTSLVSATALTYKLDANERACFFTQVQHKGTKVAFYFAVRVPRASCSRIGPTVLRRPTQRREQEHQRRGQCG
jgi:hypothetical protein